MAEATWGRKETIIWPPHQPIYTLGAFVMALVFTGMLIAIRFTFALDPMEQFYLPAYIRASLIPSLRASGKYQMLLVSDGKGHSWYAGDQDIAEGETAQQNGKPIHASLSEDARKRGMVFLFRSAPIVYQDKVLGSYLRQHVYDGASFAELFKWQLVFGALGLVLMVAMSIPKDIRRRKEMKYGRRLKGPVLVSPKQFNKAVAGSGIGIQVDQCREMIRVPQRAEDQHFEIIGDTGSGKTTIVMQMLRQIQARGHSAIVYDPACEFIERFYDENRGDIVLNPLDRRCPYWGPSEELVRRAEARTVAASLFQPTNDRKGEFFIESPQKIFAHLLLDLPSPQQLVDWMSHPEEIDRRVQDTELASLIDRSAPQQRSGVLGSLSLVADSFRLLPKKEDAKKEWTAREWSKKRKGWIFITSQPAEREALRPLHSLWIDMLVLRLLTAPTPEQHPVWFVLDELASLQKLPQLHTAITENRKSRNPIVLGFQGKAQLEVIYGHLAEVMLSQPATKIFLKTTEPNAAEWVSRAIGKIEIERMKETHFDGTRRGRNFTLDRQTEPLVLDSEISGLENLHAYIKHGNYVARFSFPVQEIPATKPKFIERLKDDFIVREPIKAPAGPPIRAATVPSEPKPTAQEKKPPASATAPKQESPLEVQASLPFGPRIYVMLTISKPLSAGQAQSYHQKEFTAKEQNYWSQQGAIAGEWQGRLASQFGLAGAVSAEDFAKLSEGQHPATGEQLVRQRASYEYQDADGKIVKTMEHRAGWDATFSAPKSVSLTALVGGDVRVRDAHRQSVNLALEQLELYTQARIGGNHPPETSAKFIAAKFEHDTARPVDGYVAPQLHTHAVIFNVTERTNGQPRAIQPQSLFASQQFATAVYQSELTYRLRQLGYEITVGRSGAPEIKGYTQEYLDASSPRSQQIRAYLERTGRAGKEAAEIAAHSTRDRKEIHSTADVMAAHRKLAADFGHQADAVVRAALERLERQQTPGNSVDWARESLTYSRDKNFEREAVVDERALIRDGLRRGMGEVTYSQVRGNLDARLAAGEFLVVERGHGMPGRQFTTAKTIQTEHEIVQRMRDGRRSVEPAMTRSAAIQFAERHPHLNHAQKTVVEDVLSAHDRIQGIQGYAGAGKTTALSTLRSAVEGQGYEVQGFAPTSRAARQLNEAGIEAGTLQGFLARNASAETATQKHFYLLDESSLASTNQVRQFLARIGPNDRVLLIGDTRQHQGVEAGRPFEQLQEAGMRTAKLDEIVRQKDPALKSAVELLAKGQTAAALEMLQQQDRVREIPSPQERIQTIAKTYAESPSNTLIVSPDNASRRELNEAVRQELRANGKLAPEDHSLRVLVQRQEMTGAERAWADHYEVGDIVRYARGSKAAGIEAGSYGTVAAINPATNLLTVKKSSGEMGTYDPRRLTGVSVYRENAREFSVGDRIQFTAPDRSLGVANRDLAAIESIAPDGRISARLDNNRQVEFSANEHRHFDHGYAVTSHSSQGLTAERVLVNADTGVHPDLLNSRFGYVSISRASHEATLFTDDMTKLSPHLSADVSKTSALEIQSPSIAQGIGMM